MVPNSQTSTLKTSLLTHQAETWTENMGKIGKAKITKNSKGKENTHIMFCPDLEHFDMGCVNDDTVDILKQCVYDMAAHSSVTFTHY